MSTTAAVAGFKVSVDVRDAASVEQGLAALGAARETIQRDGKMLYVQCAGGECPEPIHALLAEWDYQAIARIPASSTLCFARAGAVAMGTSRESSSRLRRRASARENFHALQERAEFALMRNRTYRTVRNLVLDVRGVRPSTLQPPKLRKFLMHPEQFLEDSSNPMLAGPALRVWQKMSSSSDSRDVTGYDLPERTILVLAGASTELEIKSLRAIGDGLDLRTELLVVLSSKHASRATEILAAVQCPRARAYFIAESGVDEILRYGLARSYGASVAVISASEECSTADLETVLGHLKRDCDSFVPSKIGIVGARREVWHDLLSGERSDPAMKAGVGALMSSLGTMAVEPEGTVPETEKISDYVRYPGVASYRPFDSSVTARTRVTCFDRRPPWAHGKRGGAAREDLLISVVMTVFNSARTVIAAIESVLGQTYEKVELLIVDDCSTDESLALLLEYAASDTRIRILQTARNRGTYYAKNVGLRFARGTFVTFHDSDDISSRNRLELQCEALSSDTAAIGNYTYYQRLSEDGREVWANGVLNRPGYITLMLRREDALSTVGYFDSVRASADAEYVERLQIATGREVRLLPVVAYYALQAEGSLTTSGAAAFGRDDQGRTSMPPLRKQYRDAARRWHERIYEGESSPWMPFPLGQRPFSAPSEILPTAGA